MANQMQLSNPPKAPQFNDPSPSICWPVPAHLTLDKFMKITRLVRIHKGSIAALLVFVPFMIAAAKLTFFNNGCMDGFGHFIIGAAVIVFIGGPLTVLASILLLVEFRRFFPTLTTKAKGFYLFGHALALLAMPLAIWVALETSHQKNPFDFRSELSNDCPIANQPSQMSPIPKILG